MKQERRGKGVVGDGPHSRSEAREFIHTYMYVAVRGWLRLAGSAPECRKRYLLSRCSVASPLRTRRICVG